MCLLAKIDDREFWAFYQDRTGGVELRDEHFLPSPLPLTSTVLVKDELDPGAGWREVPPATLINMARVRMAEAMVGLKNLSRI